MMVEKRREAVLTALVCREPVETGFILGTTGFTRLKPGANERRLPISHLLNHFSMPSNSTSKINTLLGGIAGVGLWSP